ncbi:tetratricopeptide repeat protein, partial [Nonomuraea sp. NPDC055795]
VEELTTVRTIDHSGRVRTIEHLPTVDPWQLQAVCWRMWHMWPAGERNLSPGPHVGVNDALQEQLWSLANEVAAAFDHDPARLCSWLAATFISPAGSAHQVTEDLAESAGVPSGLLQALATRSLLRRCPAPREYAYTIRSTRLLEPLRQLAQRSASLTHLRLRPDDWLRAAADALADGDQDRGVRHLNYVVDSTVHDMRLQVQARTMLGNMGFARGDLVMARESYQQALVLLETQQDRDAVGVMLTAIGHICLAQGDIIAAQGLFRAAAGRLPSAPSIKVELAKALARGGHPSAAVAILRTVMSVSEDQEAQVLHGRIVSEMRGSLS